MTSNERSDGASLLLGNLGGAKVEEGDTEGLRQASRDFSFPFPKAYHIQIDLMQAVFRAIEESKVGLFESPTGTVSAAEDAKSLSLVTQNTTALNHSRESP
jgi:hypothetical protein